MNWSDVIRLFVLVVAVLGLSTMIIARLLTNGSARGSIGKAKQWLVPTCILAAIFLAMFLFDRAGNAMCRKRFLRESVAGRIVRIERYFEVSWIDKRRSRPPERRLFVATSRGEEMIRSCNETLDLSLIQGNDSIVKKANTDSVLRIRWKPQRLNSSWKDGFGPFKRSIGLARNQVKDSIVLVRSESMIVIQQEPRGIRWRGVP